VFRIVVYLDDEMMKKVEKYCYREVNGRIFKVRSISSLIKEALVEYFKSHSAELEKPVRG